MKEKLTSIVAAAALASTAYAEPTKGFNAIETLHTGETRAFTNAGYTLGAAELKYHGTHIFHEGTFSDNRIGFGFKDNPMSVFVGYKTDYEQFSEFNVGVRFEKPIGDYGYVELSTNGESVSMSAVTGKFVNLPKIGKLQLEMFNQLNYDGEKLNHYGEFYALKGEKIKPFVMLSAKNMDEFAVYGGLRWTF